MGSKSIFGNIANTGKAALISATAFGAGLGITPDVANAGDPVKAPSKPTASKQQDEFVGDRDSKVKQNMHKGAAGEKIAAAKVEEHKIPEKRIDGSTWEADPIDIDDYLESVILNATKAGVLRSSDDFKKLNPDATLIELDQQIQSYKNDWKLKARNFEKPLDLSRFLTTIHSLKGRGNETKRVISDEQASVLLHNPNIQESIKITGLLYYNLIKGVNLDIIRVKAGEEISKLQSFDSKLAGK